MQKILQKKEKEPILKEAEAKREEIKNQNRDTIDSIVESLGERIIENGNS